MTLLTSCVMPSVVATPISPCSIPPWPKWTVDFSKPIGVEELKAAAKFFNDAAEYKRAVRACPYAKEEHRD